VGKLRFHTGGSCTITGTSSNSLARENEAPAEVDAADAQPARLNPICGTERESPPRLPNLVFVTSP
jgi:hypothetical protein